MIISAPYLYYRHLYWSESGQKGIVPSSVEMWDPKSNKHDIFEKAKEKADFYQVKYVRTSRV